MDAAKIAELARKSGVQDNDTENVVAFALGFAEGARNSDSTEVVHLYGACVSANVTPIWAFLEATGIPFEYHEVDLMGGAHLQEDFLAMNPYHTVPTIKHGDFCVWESSAILRYLTKAFPTSAAKFYGNGDIRSQTRIDQGLDLRQNSLYSACAPCLYPRMGFRPKISDEDLAAAEEALIPKLELFAKTFLSSSAFIGGDHPSIADFSLAGPFLHLRATPSWEKVPESIKAWSAAFDQAVPAYAKIFNGETNGIGMGVVQWMGMKLPKYGACEVGQMNA